MPSSASRPASAHTWFFPAAAVYAALVLPLSLAAMTGALPLPALAGGLGHAHEMVFGFALAVVAGYLLGPQPRGRLLALFALWAAARLGYLLWPQGLLAGGANAAFALVLAALVAPKFLSAAKKLRNQAFAPVLIGLCAAAVFAQVARGLGTASLQRLALFDGVLLLALLMLFMGGRIIAPAAAGALQRLGVVLEARVQPRIEGALIVLMLLAVLASWVPGQDLLAGFALVTAGALALVRLVRWRLWACRGRPDLMCLGVGYGWLGLGLIATGGVIAAGGQSTAVLHLITVGAFGTLTSGVVGRVWLQRAKQDPARSPVLVLIAALMAVAAVARALGGTVAADPLPLYWAAAAAWSAAFLLLARLLRRVPSR